VDIFKEYNEIENFEEINYCFSKILNNNNNEYKMKGLKKHKHKIIIKLGKNNYCIKCKNNLTKKHKITNKYYKIISSMSFMS
jgi:hypothetical protein